MVPKKETKWAKLQSTTAFFFGDHLLLFCNFYCFFIIFSRLTMDARPFQICLYVLSLRGVMESHRRRQI